MNVDSCLEIFKAIPHGGYPAHNVGINAWRPRSTYERAKSGVRGGFVVPLRKIKTKSDQFNATSGVLVAAKTVSKARKDHTALGAGIAGGGTAVATTGLVGGGIPGFKSNSSTKANLRSGSWAQRTGAAASSSRGGIFGYRTDAHHKAHKEFSNDQKYYADKPATRSERFMRGRTAGKIKPEVDVIRHLKVGRRASGVALAAGAASTAYGVHLAKKPVAKSQRDTKAYNGALLGVGGTTAGLSYGGQKLLHSQGNKWAKREAGSLAAAAKTVPNMKPGLRDNDVVKNPKILAGKSKAQAEAAGRYRGAAAQERYFAHTYHGAAKGVKGLRNPALAAAAVGAGGLALANRKDHVKKNQDIFTKAD